MHDNDATFREVASRSFKQAQRTRTCKFNQAVIYPTLQHHFVRHDVVRVLPRKASLFLGTTLTALVPNVSFSHIRSPLLLLFGLTPIEERFDAFNKLTISIRPEDESKDVFPAMLILVPWIPRYAHRRSANALAQLSASSLSAA